MTPVVKRLKVNTATEVVTVTLNTGTSFLEDQDGEKRWRGGGIKDEVKQTSEGREKTESRKRGVAGCENGCEK